MPSLRTASEGLGTLPSVQTRPHVPIRTIVDPRVPMPDGKEGSLFDALEDLDLDACIEKAKAIAAVKA